MENGKQYKTLVINGAEYKTLYTKKFKNRKAYTKPDARKVVTRISGTVVEILVEEGQSVQEGDELVLLEAMKMINRITAPVSGTIKRLGVEKGENVPKGRLIVEIE